MLEQKDAEEEKKREELKLQAKKELEDWYKQHEETITKTKSSNRYAVHKFEFPLRIYCYSSCGNE